MTSSLPGPHHEHGKVRCGMEMDQIVDRGGNGTFAGKHYFQCVPGKALLVMLKRVTLVAQGKEDGLAPGATKGQPQLRARTRSSVPNQLPNVHSSAPPAEAPGGGGGSDNYLTVSSDLRRASQASPGNATHATHAPARTRSSTSTLPDPLEILGFTADDVSGLLRQMNLGVHVASFQENQVDGELLMELDNEMLENDLGVISKLHRKRLLKLQSSI